MSEEKKQEYLSEIKESFSEIPEQYLPGVVRAITHDIGVMGAAIRIASGSAVRV